MTKHFAILLIAFSIAVHNTSAQTAAKHYCKTGMECYSGVLSMFPDYKLSKDTSYDNVRAFVYKNTLGDQLQVFYDETGAGSAKIYSIKSIIANFATMDKLYREYFGRDKTSDQLKSGDRWRIDNGTLHLSSVEEWTGYWMLRFF